MPIEKLVPTANASDSGNHLQENDFTLIDETVASADGSINSSKINDRSAGPEVVWSSITDLSEAPSSVNSATFRCRARTARVISGGDTCTYRMRCVVGGTNYDLTWNEGENSFADKTIAVGTGFTEAQYNAATVSFLQTVYNQDMGADGLEFEIDAFELEVDFNTNGGPAKRLYIIS